MEGKHMDGQEESCDTAVVNPAGLDQFLAKEVHHVSYTNLLLECAEAAGTANVKGASGNAYNVLFGPEQVTIKHHCIDNWPPVQISCQHFISTLHSWKAAGCGNTSA
jgi:hypothetical protein